MNTRSSFYDIKSFYNKKAVLKASFHGMRYQVEKKEKKEEDVVLLATVWPEPFCFERTPKEYQEEKEFTYDESGLDAAYQWICDVYEERRQEWDYAEKNPMIMADKMGIRKRI